MFLLFVGLVGSTFFVLLVWAGGMVYRLYNPDHPEPFEKHPVVQRESVPVQGGCALVGVREIRAEQRREHRQSSVNPDYVLGVSDGIPESWQRDLWHRRN